MYAPWDVKRLDKHKEAKLQSQASCFLSGLATPTNNNVSHQSSPGVELVLRSLFERLFSFCVILYKCEAIAKQNPERDSVNGSVLLFLFIIKLNKP